MLVWETTAGHRTRCSKRAPGLLAAPPAPKHWLARGVFSGSGVQLSLGSLSKRSERREYEGTGDWGEESDRLRGEEASRRCPGGRLGARGRKCPRSGSLNTWSRPEGRAPSRNERGGQLAPAEAPRSEGNAQLPPRVRDAPRSPPGGRGSLADK